MAKTWRSYKEKSRESNIGGNHEIEFRPCADLEIKMERPILFSEEMVRAILDGRKTMTRRVIKKAWDGFSWAGDVLPAKETGWIAWWPKGDAEFTKRAYNEGFPCPYGQLEDRLWVKETWFCDDLGSAQDI